MDLDNFTELAKNAKLASKKIATLSTEIKNNALLYNLVFYGVMEKMKTVQTVENVLSYIKGSDAREVKDVSFKNGEIRIKCSI